MIGILFTARLGSSRLHQKHLIDTCGRTMIEWLIYRFESKFKEELKNLSVKLVLATSTNSENKEFIKVLKDYNVEVFQGDDKNIPLRYNECAKKYNFEYVIIVDGDDILVSTNAAKIIYNEIKLNTTFQIIQTEGLPLGLNLSAYKSSYLNKSLEHSKNLNLEIGWTRIFENPSIKKIELGKYKLQSDYRFTLDYEDDAIFFKNIICYYKEQILDVSDEEILKFVDANNLTMINKHLSEQYWDNYFKSVNKAINNEWQ